MKSPRNREAFTLIEILIVVVIMAVLAATIIPQFSSSTKDAKDSTARFNVHSLRSLIEMYKLHHKGSAPTLDATNNTLPQLLGSTDINGTVGTGASYPYGPYTQYALPQNPFTGSTKVQAASASGTPTASGDSDAGWLYRASTGEIWLDDAGFVTQ